MQKLRDICKKRMVYEIYSLYYQATEIPNCTLEQWNEGQARLKTLKDEVRQKCQPLLADEVLMAHRAFKNRMNGRSEDSLCSSDEGDFEMEAAISNELHEREAIKAEIPGKRKRQDAESNQENHIAKVPRIK